MTRRFIAAVPLFTLTLTACALLIRVAAPEPSAHFDLLVLDREQPRLWPWLTAHFLHTDNAHLGWNLVAFVGLGWLGERGGRGRFFESIAAGIIAVDIWFAWIDATLRFYCGLSGVLNTVLLATLYGLRREIAAPWLIGVAGLVALKLGIEWHSGVALFTHTRWPPAVGAHIAGFVAGLILVAAYAWSDRTRGV